MKKNIILYSVIWIVVAWILWWWIYFMKNKNWETQSKNKKTEKEIKVSKETVFKEWTIELWDREVTSWQLWSLDEDKIVDIATKAKEEEIKTNEKLKEMKKNKWLEEDDEIPEEMKKEFLKWFEKLEIRDFEWYLIDSWDWEIDIDIKNITFWVKQDEKKKENCDKEKWTCDLKDFTVIDENEILSKKEFKLSFSTIKKELTLTSLENWKENVEIKFNWEKTNEWYKFTINISPTIEWKKLQDVISIISVNWLNSTENWEEWKSHNMITIKKELWQSWWFFEFDKNIVIKFDYEIKTDFNWFEDITNPEKSISYTKLENDIKKLENKNDLVQEKIDWNLEIKDKNIKK